MSEPNEHPARPRLHRTDRQKRLRPQHFLYFLPLPHGQGSFRPTRGVEAGRAGVPAMPGGGIILPGDGAA